MSAQPVRWRLTLTTRLTLLYTAASACVLLGMGALTARAVTDHFDELDQITLHEKMEVVRELASATTTLPEFTRRLDDALQGHEGLVVRVLEGYGANSETIYATAGAAFPPPAHWQSLQQTLASTNSPSGKVTVLAAFNPVHHGHFMSQFQLNLALYVALATLASGLLGWWAARNGLSPLRAMKARAQTVSAHQLDARMPVHAVPVELADLAQSLNEMLMRLQNDFERLSSFSSDLAHELRTPISNLMTETQVTLSQKRTVDIYRNALASNSEELERLARMVSDMLFLAKAENGLALPHSEFISLSTEVAALVDFYDALAAEKRVLLVVTGKATVQGDKLMLRRAISNLMSNAIRHSTEGGQIFICIEVDDQSARLSVSNNGEAIDSTVLLRLFDRFYRADAARRHPSSDGAGLGLSITRAIMQAHGGSVIAMSADGVNRFELRFPLAA